MIEVQYKENLLQAARDGNVKAIESFLDSDIDHETKNALACAARDAAELAMLSLETTKQRSQFHAFFERFDGLRRAPSASLQLDQVKELDTHRHEAIVKLLARFPLGVVDSSGSVPETRF